MELLNFLKQIPFPVLLVAVLILLVVTLVIAFQYAKHKGLEGIREQVYQLILKAEHMYKESGTGQQKLKWVVQQARGLLPKWLQVIMSEDALLKIIDVWFCGVKDLLDDGKINGSQKEGLKPFPFLGGYYENEYNGNCSCYGPADAVIYTES